VSNKPRLLLVEDEPSILRGLTDLFIFHGYEVDSEIDGLKGLEQARCKNYSCVILDVMLPSMSGFEICDNLRKHSLTLPILMLTAKSSEEDIINGLTLGADDYVAKPFSTSELVLRVNALVRRAGSTVSASILTIGDQVSVCTKTLTGESYQHPQKYTRREVDILCFLNNHKKPVSRDELLREVWGYKTTGDIDTRTVDIHMAKIRKKIEKDPKSPQYLITHRGEGYQLYSA